MDATETRMNGEAHSPNDRNTSNRTVANSAAIQSDPEIIQQIDDDKDEKVRIRKKYAFH